MSLQDFMQEDDILILRHSPSSLKESIEACCSLLLKKNKITLDYPKAIYESHKKLGAYYVVAPKVALPHSRPENGVLKEGIQITIFKEGADFNANENGKVFLSVAFASLGAERHIQLIGEIASLLEKGELIEEIIKKETTTDVWEIIKQKRD